MTGTRNRNCNGLPRSGYSRIGIDPHLVKRGTEPEHIGGSVRRFVRGEIQCESSYEEQCRMDRDAHELGGSRASLMASLSARRCGFHVTWHMRNLFHSV